MVPAVLYISYDGMLEPLGKSQVLGYLERLASDYSVHLVSFEKKADRKDGTKLAAMSARLQHAGISWTPLGYHKAPSALATAYDIAIGSTVAVWITFRRRVRFVHARSYVPAVMAVVVKRLTGAKFLFDMRGFWADERVDGRLWKAGSRLYRTAKAIERRLLLAADHVVTLTHASAREISGFSYLRDQMPPLTVIPTCADLDLFRPKESSNDGPFTLGNIGTVGTWYLLDQLMAFYRAILRRIPDARLLIVNRNEHDLVRAAIDDAKLDPSQIEIVAAEPEEVAGLVARMTVGAAIYRPAYSNIARAPTKLAEYLGCGIPCVGTTNVGDMESVLTDERVGVVLENFSESSHAAAVEQLLSLLDDLDLADRCAVTARRLFSLDAGVDAFREVYQSLAGAPMALGGNKEPRAAESK